MQILPWQKRIHGQDLERYRVHTMILEIHIRTLPLIRTRVLSYLSCWFRAVKVYGTHYYIATWEREDGSMDQPQWKPSEDPTDPEPVQLAQWMAWDQP